MQTLPLRAFHRSRYQDFRAFPDGSVASSAPSTGNQIKILRVLPCS
jgi:hypothetical protein